jgi:hypothetical protein
MITASQRAVLAVLNALPAATVEARARLIAGGARGGGRLSRSSGGAKASTVAGAEYGVSARMVERASQLVSKRPDLARRVLGQELGLKGAIEAMRSDLKPGAQKVYFVQAEKGLIKIGRALAVGVRLAELQTGSPLELTLLVDAVARPGLTEAELHKTFASARVRGEWFHPVPELLALVAKLRANPELRC